MKTVVHPTAVGQVVSIQGAPLDTNWIVGRVARIGRLGVREVHTVDPSGKGHSVAIVGLETSPGVVQYRGQVA